ncbi:MAG: hypothetical protein JWP29_5635 [Rhodoferax sp.]|nr:hypothetical protein [Rhodoferax sp.]
MEGCSSSFGGKSASNSLKRHLKKSHPEHPELLEGLPRGKAKASSIDARAQRQGRNSRYKAKFPMRHVALMRLQSYKKVATIHLEEHLMLLKPCLSEMPLLKAKIDPSNIFFTLEETLGVYVGRTDPIYTSAEARNVSFPC